MSHRTTTITDSHWLWPRWWRMAVVAVSTLILCSCRGPLSVSPLRTAVTAPHPETLPRSAFTGRPGDGYTQPGPPNEETQQIGAPLMVAPGLVPPGHIAAEGVAPAAYVQQWAPPGVDRPWPPEEYLFDGGDNWPHAAVGRDWEVHGLEQEDTVVHYDTLDGRTDVQPSNRVCIYAPRFAAVRHITNMGKYDRLDTVAGVDHQTQMVLAAETQGPTAVKQPVPPGEQAGRRPPVAMLSEQRYGGLSTAVGVDEQSVQLVIENHEAIVKTGDKKAQTIFTVDTHGKPEVAVCKTASKHQARPGDEIEFTITFKNTGHQEIGNVTIIDNLATRFELIAGSARCSLGHRFVTEPNDGGSLALRWEINDPMPTGKQGEIRFKCRVR